MVIFLIFSFILLQLVRSSGSSRQLINQKNGRNNRTLGELELAPPTNSFFSQPQGLLLLSENEPRKGKEIDPLSVAFEIITRNPAIAAEHSGT
jgi:hypothetical protein